MTWFLKTDEKGAGGSAPSTPYKNSEFLRPGENAIPRYMEL